MAHTIGKFFHSLESKNKISKKLKGTKCGGFNVFSDCKHCGRKMNAANFSRHETACLRNISYKRLFNNPISTNKFKTYRRKLLLRYGITIEEYAKLFDEQNGKCKICERKSERNSLCVDHCHKTLKIRGLLCDKCNFLLGHSKDSIKILKAAIDYLSLDKDQ